MNHEYDFLIRYFHAFQWLLLIVLNLNVYLNVG